MELDQIKAEFEKFYNASPFAGGGEKIRIAMEGAYLAGYILLAEELKKKL